MYDTTKASIVAVRQSYTTISISIMQQATDYVLLPSFELVLSTTLCISDSECVEYIRKISIFYLFQNVSTGIVYQNGSPKKSSFFKYFKIFSK